MYNMTPEGPAGTDWDLSQLLGGSLSDFRAEIFDNILMTWLKTSPWTGLQPQSEI